MKPGNRQQMLKLVPIHSKRLLWQMRERILSYKCLSAFLREGIF